MSSTANPSALPETRSLIGRRLIGNPDNSGPGLRLVPHRDRRGLCLQARDNRLRAAFWERCPKGRGRLIMLDVPGFVFDVRGLVGVLPRIRREKQYPGAKRQDGGCQRDGGRPTFTQRFQIVLEARAKRDVNFIEATLYRVGEVFERRAYYHGAKMATKRRVFL